MQVFKAFYKIVRENLGTILLYIFIFIFFAVFLTSSLGKKQEETFTDTKSNIALFNNDQDSPFLEGFEQYLTDNANIVEIGDDTKSLQDSFYFRHVEYIVTIPEGFTQDFLAGKNVTLDTATVPDSTTSVYLDNMINLYLNTARTYLSSLDNISEEQLVANIKKDLAISTPVTFLSSDATLENNGTVSYFYNYLSYSLLAIFISCIGLVLLVFNDTDLKKRNLCSPIPSRKISLQLFAGTMSFSIIIWIFMISLSFIMYSDVMFTFKGALYMLNSFALSLAAISIAFFIGSITKNRGVLSAATTAIPLGFSFIGGAFVPQQFISDTVLRIASFTPTYWYVLTNDSIATMSHFSWEKVMPLVVNMLIILGFAVAFLTITLVVLKQRRQK